MKAVKKLLALVLASALALTLLTGCGGGGGGGNTITVNGQRINISKAHIDDLEKTFTAAMTAKGYTGVTYSAERTDQAEYVFKTVVYGAAATQTNNTENKVGMAYATYEGAPNWGAIGVKLADQLEEAAAEAGGVTFTRKTYGYINATNQSNGRGMILLIIGYED